MCRLTTHDQLTIICTNKKTFKYAAINQYKCDYDNQLLCTDCKKTKNKTDYHNLKMNGMDWRKFDKYVIF